MRLPRLPLVTALTLLFFFAYVTGVRLAYSLLYALILLFVVSYLWSRLAADNLVVERASPEGQFQVGDAFEESFVIQNRSWIPVPLIELTDFSNLPGYNPGRVFSLKGRRARRWTSRGRFKQRGLFTFGPVELRYGDPFGLFTRTLRVAGSQAVVVYPVVRPVGGLDALAPSTAGDEQLRGRVLDIPPNATTIREYVPTDSVKRIHWASSARLGRLMSRSFETREGGDAWIVLDLQASVHAGEAPESTLEYAMSLAASIADAALRRGSAIGLVSNDSRLSCIEAARGDQQQTKTFQHVPRGQADCTVSLVNLGTILLLAAAAIGGAWAAGLLGVRYEDGRLTLRILRAGRVLARFDFRDTGLLLVLALVMGWAAAAAVERSAWVPETEGRLVPAFAIATAFGWIFVVAGFRRLAYLVASLAATLGSLLLITPSPLTAPGTTLQALQKWL